MPVLLCSAGATLHHRGGCYFELQGPKTDINCNQGIKLFFFLPILIARYISGKMSDVMEEMPIDILNRRSEISYLVPVASEDWAYPLWICTHQGKFLSSYQQLN